MQWVAVSQLKLSCIPVSLKALHYINEALYNILSKHSIDLMPIPEQFPIKYNSSNSTLNPTLVRVLVHYTLEIFLLSMFLNTDEVYFYASCNR